MSDYTLYLANRTADLLRLIRDLTAIHPHKWPPNVEAMREHKWYYSQLARLIDLGASPSIFEIVERRLVIGPVGQQVLDNELSIFEAISKFSPNSTAGRTARRLRSAKKIPVAELPSALLLPKLPSETDLPPSTLQKVETALGPRLTSAQLGEVISVLLKLYDQQILGEQLPGGA